MLVLQPESKSHSHGARPTTASRKTFINFVSAKQRSISQKASNKAKQRGKELLNIIDLDVAHFDIFDMPPISEYELYMRNFGRSDTKQVTCSSLTDIINYMLYISPGFPLVGKIVKKSGIRFKFVKALKR